MDATELNNQFIKENEDIYISSIVNYNDNINTKKSIETTIEKINDTNTKINTDKLKDLIRREITVYFPLNSIDSKDFPMTIDYISEDMYSLLLLFLITISILLFLLIRIKNIHFCVSYTSKS